METMTKVSNFCLEQVALRAIRLGIGDERVRVEAVPAFGGDKIELKVNWLSIGECTPAEAAEFAAAITRASHLAASFSFLNGAEVVYRA